MALQVRAGKGLARVGNRLLRHRVALLTLAAVGIGLIAGDIKAWSDDEFFLAAGQQLVHGHLDRVFSDPGVQIGPLYALLAGLVSVACTPLGLDERSMLAGAAAGIATQLLLAVARRLIAVLSPLSDERTRAVRETIATAIVVLGGPLFVNATFGHYEDLMVVLGITWAALAAHEGRAMSAGGLLALSGSVKLWALLGVAVILLLPALIQRVRAVFIATVVLGAAYLPFLATKSVGTFAYWWTVYPTSPVALFLHPMSLLGWDFRGIQGALVVAVSVAVLAAVPGLSPWRVWSVPTAVVAARIITDPQMLVYYWTPAMTLLALGLCVRPPSGPGGTVNPALYTVPIATFAVTLQQLLQPAAPAVDRVLAVGNGVAGVALVVAAVLIGRRGSALGEPHPLLVESPELSPANA